MTYKLLLTTLGQSKIAAAANSGATSIELTQFAVGQGVDVDFSKRLDEQVLVSKRYQGNVESVAKVASRANQYEITCIVPIDEGGWTIREFGLIDADGDLIWVGQLPNVQKPDAGSTAAVDYRIKAVVSIDNPDVNLIIDANVIMATQSWAFSTFAPISHLTDANAHSQYVLKSVYDAHVAQNTSEHSQLSQWQQNHLAAPDPHPQYAMSVDVANLIEDLQNRIAFLESSANTGILVAALTIHFADTKYSKNDFSGDGVVSVDENQGYEFNHQSSYSLPHRPVGNHAQDYEETIIIGLPVEYNSSEHRLVISSDNGSYRIDDTNNLIVFNPLVSSSRDGDGVIKDSMSATFTIKIYNL